MSLSEEQANAILLQVLKENAGLAKIHNKDNTVVKFAPLDRITKNNIYGGGGQLEYWPVEEEGLKDYPHPAPGKIALEIFQAQLMQNPEILKRALRGDLMHGMMADTYYKGLHDQFRNNYTPETLAFEQKANRQGWRPNAVHDMYIRGYLNPDERDEFRKHQAQSGNVYSPRQLEILNEMEQYIKTGQGRAEY